MNIEIGLQLFSIRDELKKDYEGALEKVASIGYENMELITRVVDNELQFGEGLSSVRLRHLLDSLGLKAVGCHVMPIEGMVWESVIDSCLETGAKAFVIPFAMFNSRQDVVSLCWMLNQAAVLCEKKGIQFYYHNHFQEFQEFDGQVVMDTLLENTDKDLVMFEFDSYWAVRAGQDPVAWLGKLGKRCDLLHQKDLPSEVQPVNLFELVVDHPPATFQEMRKAVTREQFTEIGAGVLPVAEIIAAGRKYGNARYVFVEQDMTARGEIESIMVSYQNLAHLLKMSEGISRS